MRRLVTPLMAETTTATGNCFDALATIVAERRMQEASPTEVPPNFITCSFEFIFQGNSLEKIILGDWFDSVFFLPECSRRAAESSGGEGSCVGESQGR